MEWKKGGRREGKRGGDWGGKGEMGWNRLLRPSFLAGLRPKERRKDL